MQKCRAKLAKKAATEASAIFQMSTRAVGSPYASGFGRSQHSGPLAICIHAT
jgi:hypothetical protein